MILIVGCNHDDVLYYETVLKKPREEVILNHFHVLIGNIASQEVMIVQDVYTSYMTSMLISYLIDHYLLTLVINVGRCIALKGSLKIGDVALSDSIVFGDVDQIAKVKGTRLGQIPNLPDHYEASLELVNNMNVALDTLLDSKHYNATFISSSFFRQNKEMVGDISEDEYIQSLNNNIVMDGESAGMALACHFFDVPFISVKIVEANAGEYTSLENYIMIIEKYASLGKSIVAFIGEISRSDVLRMQEVNK